MDIRIGFIGAGKMGGAILSSLLAGGAAPASQTFVFDVSGERLKSLAADLGIVPAGSVREAVLSSDAVFLCVKPQDLGKVLSELDEECVSGRLFISIAAGRRIDWLEERLPGARVVRVMPNLAVSVGAGMTVFSPGKLAGEDDCALVAGLLANTGAVKRLPEETLDGVTALSGSGPAFLAWFLEAMAEAGPGIGLDAATAGELAVQTMLGTAKVLAGGGVSVRDFIKSVTSARGTTAEGLSVLEASDAAAVVGNTLAAAARRSRELSMLP